MRRLSTLIITACLAITVWANFNDEVNTYKAHEKTLLAGQQNQVSKLGRLSQVQIQKNLALVNHFISQAHGSYKQNLHAGGKAADGAILFVSFSMPKALILQMASQAEQYHIPVMLRGMVANSVPKTLQAIMDLKSAAKKVHQHFSGVGIDPVWFEQFHITAVPALVVTRRPAGCVAEKYCANQPFDVVYGNQSIEDSLYEIAQKGSAIPRKVALELLEEAHHV